MKNRKMLNQSIQKLKKEEKDCKYAIRLKENQPLLKLAEEENQALYRATKFNQVDYAVMYGEFLYQAGSWSHPRRVVFKIEKPYGQMIHTHSLSPQWKNWCLIKSSSFTVAVEKWKTSSKRGKAALTFPLAAVPVWLSTQTACRPMCRHTIYSIGSGGWHWQQA